MKRIERLTIKNKEFNDYSVAEELRLLDVRDYLYKANQKLGKIEDLEEQMGCPLEILVKNITDGKYLELLLSDMEQKRDEARNDGYFCQKKKEQFAFYYGRQMAFIECINKIRVYINRQIEEIDHEEN